MNGGHNDEKGTLHKPKLGSPQGGILIPLVAKQGWGGVVVADCAC